MRPAYSHQAKPFARTGTGGVLRIQSVDQTPCPYTILAPPHPCLSSANTLPPAVPCRCQLLSLAGQLFQPELSYELRLHIASQMRSLLDPCLPLPSEWIPPPGSPALLDLKIT
jgi:hypothetical protein